MVLRKTASPCCGGAGGLGSCEQPSVVGAVGCINLMLGQATCLALCFRWDQRDGGTSYRVQRACLWTGKTNNG